MSESPEMPGPGTAASGPADIPTVVVEAPWYFSTSLLAMLIVLVLFIVILLILVTVLFVRSPKDNRPAMTRIHSTTQRIDSYTTAVNTVLFDTVVENVGKSSTQVTYDPTTGLFTSHFSGLYVVSFTTAVVSPIAGEPPLAVWVRTTLAGSTPGSEQPFGGYTEQVAHGVVELQQPISFSTTVPLRVGDRFDIRATVIDGSINNNPRSIGNASTPWDGEVVTQMAVTYLVPLPKAVMPKHEDDCDDDSDVAEEATIAVVDTAATIGAAADAAELDTSEAHGPPLTSVPEALADRGDIPILASARPAEEATAAVTAGDASLNTGDASLNTGDASLNTDDAFEMWIPTVPLNKSRAVAASRRHRRKRNHQ